MLVMVLAENMVQFILGWEIMGLCSFMLIGHWWEEEANSRAALKAFFTVRVGDVGLLVGTIDRLLRRQPVGQDNLDSNGFNISAIQAGRCRGDGVDTRAAVGAVALFIACIGKSRPVPAAHLAARRDGRPDARVVAAALSTMVVAGVFLVARLYPVFCEGFNIAGSDCQAHRRDRRRSRSSSPRCSRSCRTTSRRCSPTRRCPARLHDAGPRRRRLDAGRVPHLHARLLQVLPVPVRRLGRALGLAPLAST